MELTTGQSIYYSNKGQIAIEDVAASLLALKAMLEITPDVLERIAPGLHIQKVFVHLSEIKTGSLWEDVVVKFIWGSQDKLSADVAKLREGVHMEQIMESKKLLACIVLALILGGGYLLLTKNKAPEEQKAIIQANQNTIINIGAEMSGLSAEQFKSIIDGTIARNSQALKDAVKIVRPAKREEGASITMNEEDSTSINSKAVRAMPSIFPDDDSIEIIEDFTKVEIQIRATDLDSTKKSWAAVVPSVNSRRSKMHIDPHIKPGDLIGKTSIFGDVTIVFKHDDAGNKMPSLIFLREIHQ
jgi:hypothetical protein